MAQIQKIEIQTEIKSCADKFYEIIRRKAYLTPKICPDIVKDIQVVQGDWDSVGSIRVWTYVAGDSEKVKETMEAIDENNKTINFNMLEGELMKYYKVYKPKLHVTPNFAKWTVEYEKQNEDIPPPHKYLEFLANFNKIIDAYLLNNKKVDWCMMIAGLLILSDVAKSD